MKKGKIPFLGLGPENTKKKPKKYKNGEFWAIFVVFFSVFFSYFRAQPGNGDLVFFFRNFFVFSGFRGLCNLYQARRVANIATKGVKPN